MNDAIRLTDLCVRYGRVRALDGLSLAVTRSEIYGFLGRNGAGKTTTLRVLMGIVGADGGTIELFGQAMKRVSVATKRSIGYVSQEQNFYPWMTPLQLGRFVAAFYPTWDDDEYAHLLRVLDVPPNRRSGVLSGGTRPSSASRSRSHRGRRCCCWTSRRLGWIPSRAASSTTWSRGWRRSAALPCSYRRTSLTKSRVSRRVSALSKPGARASRGASTSCANAYGGCPVWSARAAIRIRTRARRCVASGRRPLGGGGVARGYEVDPLPLEEIFLAFARTDASAASAAA